jgi:uncharacterized membrane protein YgdD (TMEM256/DUF423 family)
MSASTRKFIIAGALSAALAIGLGAFGAHALRTSLSPRMLEIYHTAVLYHLVHSLGLLAVAFVCFLKPASRAAEFSGWLMSAGIILFSGSLYMLAVTGLKWLGAITPLGGIALMAAWLLLAAAALRS